jgi:hypothetical protein
VPLSIILEVLLGDLGKALRMSMERVFKSTAKNTSLILWRVNASFLNFSTFSADKSGASENYNIENIISSRERQVRRTFLIHVRILTFFF